MRAVLLDLDGVLYTGDDPVPGAVRTVDWLMSQHVPFRYLTNTTSRPRAAIADKLTGMGIHAAPDRILTPALAAAAWLRHHGITRPALFVPRPTAAEFADLDPLPDSAERGAGAVVVGDLGELWDFPTLNRAFRLLMEDRRIPLVALGLTRYWRADDGLRLDAGAYARGLEYASGRAAVVMGKPDPAFFLTAVDTLGVAPQDAVMVGDDLRTDVQAAQRAGLTGLLVRTGKFTPADLSTPPEPDGVLDSIADLPGWWTNH